MDSRGFLWILVILLESYGFLERRRSKSDFDSSVQKNTGAGETAKTPRWKEYINL